MLARTAIASVVVLAAGLKTVQEPVQEPVQAAVVERPTQEEINLVATQMKTQHWPADGWMEKLWGADEKTMRTHFKACKQVCLEKKNDDNEHECMQGCRPIEETMLERFRPARFKEYKAMSDKKQ